MVTERTRCWETAFDDDLKATRFDYDREVVPRNSVIFQVTIPSNGSLSLSHYFCFFV